jgi:hypothetical protein
MKKLALLGAAAVLATAFATPSMAQGVTQEPGSIGFNYPNSRYLTGSYGVGTPYNTGRYPRMGYYRQVYYGPVYHRPYYGPGPGEVAAGVVGGALGTAAAIAAAPFEPYDSYDYYSYDPY